MTDTPQNEKTTPDRREYKPHTSFARLRRLCTKELREILRDRRTIITLILMPLLVYPLLSITFQRLFYMSVSTETNSSMIIGVNDEDALSEIEYYLLQGERLLAEENAQSSTSLESADEEDKPPPTIEWKGGNALKQHVEEGMFDLAVLVRKPATSENDQGVRSGLKCELIYRENSAVSNRALDFVSRRFDAVNRHYLRQQVERLGGQVRLLTEVSSQDVGTDSSELSLTTLVPLILILMTITGAVYPAIDLTAGERERGTLEMLMAAPVPRLALLAAKYVAVLTVALLTAGANLLAMTITLYSTGLNKLVFGNDGLSMLTMVQVLALLVLFAAFFSAILLALTSFARSFKEAQAYLIPVMLLSLAPGMLSLMPGIELNRMLAIAPLVNIVLLARDVFKGSVDPTLAMLAVSSTLLYTLGAISVAARVFGTDALLYGSEGGWSDLLARSSKSRDAASLPIAMFCVGVLMPFAILLAGVIGQRERISMSVRLLLNAAVLAVLFAGLPILAAALQRVRLRLGFRLQRPGLLALSAGVILGISTWPWAHEVFLLNKLIGLSSLTAHHFELAKSILAQWEEIPLPLILFSLALVPAICEELFFRGYLFRAMERATSAGRTIWMTALIFGIFHVVASGQATPERFLPSTFLGFLLGWVAWRSGSVWPGMVLHACHNAVVLTLAYYYDELAEFGWGVREGIHLPSVWLAASAVAIAFGMGLLHLAARRRARTMPQTAATVGTDPP